MSRTILLADDSLTIQKVVELTFMEEDFDVVSVSDGDRARAKLEELTPALVIADVHMPGASGYEVCRQVKATHPGVPVLLLVGTFEIFDEEEARSAGADGHLKKPFDSQELSQMVEGLVGGGEAPAVEADSMVEEGAAAIMEVEFEPVSSMAEEVPGELEEMAFDDGDLGFVAEEVPPEPEEAPPPPPAEASAMPSTAPPAAAVAGDLRLSEEDVERIARKVVEYLGEDIVREISWEVIPDLAEIVIKNRLRELEEQID